MRTGEFESTSCNSARQRWGNLRAIIRRLAGLLFLSGLVTPGAISAQTDSVRLNFSDGVPTILSDSLNDPFADSNTIQASVLLPSQESDFVPETDKPPTDDRTGALDSPSSSKDDAIEMLQLGDREKANPTEKLDSDDPVEAPTFELSGAGSDESSQNEQAPTDPNQSNSIQRNFNDGYQLPTVADVRAPISFAPLASTSQYDPSGLLSDDQSINFRQRYVAPNSTYAEISTMPAAAKFKTWKAHNVYHRPTYFEDQNLELNGNQRPFQNVASAVSFFSTIPRIPYLLGEHHPEERIYTYGEDRPGDAAAFRIYRPDPNRKGRVFQTIATLGLILP